MTTYSMTPINSGTRLRTDHNTFATVIASYNSGALILGDELWEAPADGLEVRKGDKWLHVVSVNGVKLFETGWMAYVHKGLPICNNFKTIVDVPPPAPSPVPMFPESFTLTDPQGNKAEYQFVRILE